MTYSPLPPHLMMLGTITMICTGTHRRGKIILHLKVFGLTHIHIIHPLLFRPDKSLKLSPIGIIMENIIPQKSVCIKIATNRTKKCVSIISYLQSSINQPRLKNWGKQTNAMFLHNQALTHNCENLALLEFPKSGDSGVSYIGNYPLSRDFGCQLFPQSKIFPNIQLQLFPGLALL